MAIFLRVLLDRVRRHQAGTLFGLAALFVVLGGVLFSVTQHLPVTTGLYWAVITATTVGYGDVTPHNASGRIVAVGEMLTAIPVFGAAFALLAAVATAARSRSSAMTSTSPTPNAWPRASRKAAPIAF